MGVFLISVIEFVVLPSLSLSLHPCVYVCWRLCIFLSFGTISLFVMAKMVDCLLAAQPKWGLRSAGYAKLTSPMMLCQFHNMITQCVDDLLLLGIFLETSFYFCQRILKMVKLGQGWRKLAEIPRNSLPETSDSVMMV